MCFIQNNQVVALGWHFIFLASELIIPPTIIAFALIRHLYPPQENSQEGRTPETPVS